MQVQEKRRPGRPPSEFCLQPGDWHADHLRVLRKQRHMTMEALAEAIGVTRMMIHLAEKGKRLSPRLAKNLLIYFGVPASEIVIGETNIFLVNSVKIG